MRGRSGPLVPLYKILLSVLSAALLKSNLKPSVGGVAAKNSSFFPLLMSFAASLDVSSMFFSSSLFKANKSFNCGGALFEMMDNGLDASVNTNCFDVGGICDAFLAWGGLGPLGGLGVEGIGGSASC